VIFRETCSQGEPQSMKQDLRIDPGRLRDLATRIFAATGS
jgi:hypothetical protein